MKINWDLSNLKRRLTDAYWDFGHYGGTYLIMRTKEPEWVIHYLKNLLPRGISIEQTPSQNFNHPELGSSVELSTNRGTKADEWLMFFIKENQFFKVPYMD